MEKENHQLSWWRLKLKLYTKILLCYIEKDLAVAQCNDRRIIIMRNDYNSLSHTKWRCQYHIVLTPKYRRQVIYGKYKIEIGKILRTLCERNGIEIIEANACKDHIHMLVSIPPKMSVSKAMGILKGKSALMIFDRFANLKYKYGNRHFWCRGYFVDTVGRNKTAIQKYIQEQVDEDQMVEQMSMKEYIDPFMGTPVKEGK